MMMTTTVMMMMRTTTTVMARVLHGQVVWKVLSGESCGLIAVLFCTKRTQQIIRTRVRCVGDPVEMNAASDDVCEGEFNQNGIVRMEVCAVSDRLNDVTMLMAYSRHLQEAHASIER